MLELLCKQITINNIIFQSETWYTVALQRIFLQSLMIICIV